ncbi:MAG: antiviral reverse transcriptase Drt3a, partial [Cyclobacteriaceae bacterium]
MFDQSFSSTEFKEIFDNENRKGNDLENKFKNEFIESLKLIPQLKASNLKIKQETDKNNLIVLLEERKEIKANRVAAINNILKIASTNIQAKINNLKLLQGPLNGTKPTYRIEPRLENVLMLKKLQYNVFKTYKVVQSSRHAILSQFINLISDTLPKYVVRVDLSSFYERIPQIQLRKKITEDHLLNVSSKKLITKILDEYNKLTSQIDINTAQGVPRGVGISSYLSELFMRDIDNKIKRMDDLVYYARYVDDMIIVFVPKTITVQKRELKNYETKTFNIIKESGMIVNDKKSESYNLVMKKDGLT